MRVGINGFGRIGRLVLRAGFDEPDLEFVVVNDIADHEMLAYLLQFDSVHGLSDFDVALTDSCFNLDGQDITVLQQTNPREIPWRDLGVELVIEASGRFTTREDVQAHLQAGAQRVIITAPAKDPDITVVVGVNDDTYDPDRHMIISTASCTTNTLAVVADVLHNAFEIQRGFALTMHAYTNSQVLLDKPSSKLRRARAAALNLVPTSTGAARTLGAVLPELHGRIEAMAIRAPLPVGSIIDLTVNLGREVDADAINQALIEASETDILQEILLVSHDPLVSSDIVGTSFTAIVDAESTAVLGNMARVLTWYDNEWGYACRVIDMAVRVAAT